MKREPLKVGDRVAVYDTISDNGIRPWREVGRVDYVGDDGLLRVIVAHRAPYFVHPKCCRRLIRRKRRRVWLEQRNIPGAPGKSNGALIVTSDPEEPGWIEFIEARPRKERK